MQNGLWTKGVVVGVMFVLLEASFIPSIVGDTGIIKNEGQPEIQQLFLPIASEVWVDDDYYNGGYNDGHTWGVDAFDNIQDGIDTVIDTGTVYVKEGIYEVFTIEGRASLDIIGEDQPIVTGNQLAYDTSYPAYVYNVIFVNNSDDVRIRGLYIIGTNPVPSARDFTVFFQRSDAELQDCTIDANNIGNMNGLAIRTIINSSLTISNCIIKDYGRIAIYAKTATTLNVLNCTLTGTIYHLLNQVNYGIEIEGINAPCDALIKGNEIYNHDNTQTAAWSSAGIIVDYWRYYGPGYLCFNSTVLIENNHIHDNMHGLQIVPNENIDVVYNKIHGNGYGAISEPWFDGSTYHDVDLQALNNWWGHPTGPYHPDGNPGGLGDEIFGDVLFDPWTTSIASDLVCNGSLNWDDVPAGGTVTGIFTIENNGYRYSELSWAVDEKPTWGVWTITPESGTGLTPGMGAITVQVLVTAPQKKNRQFTGKLTVINTENASDYCEIDIYLKTPTSAPFTFKGFIVEWLVERFPNAFPFLRILLGH